MGDIADGDAELRASALPPMGTPTNGVNGSNGTGAVDVPPGLSPPEKKPAPSSTGAALPPGLLPPGTGSLAKTKKDEGEDLADDVKELKVNEDVVDSPDISLKSKKLRDPSHEIETKTVDNTMYRSAQTFEDLGLRQDLLNGLYSGMNFEKPSAIQARTLPMILTPPFRSLIAQAHNGSGKTTCFVLAMLTRVNPDLKAPQALCVCPTRELVKQNLAVLRKMGQFTKIESCSTATIDEDGIGERSRISQQVVVGTHGKIKWWLTRRILALQDIVVLVLDEADNMLDRDGFAGDSVRMIRDIQRKSKELQVLLFSATFNEEVKDFARVIFKEDVPNEVFVPKEELSLDVIKQYRVVAPDLDAKYKVLKDMIFPNCEKLGQTIIFVRSRDGARNLHRRLMEDGNTCTAISGQMDFETRDKVIDEFRKNTTRILVATDVLSRGFDVSDVTLVVNYDIPIKQGDRSPDYETYLHRIGRSGRFGRKGAAFNLVCNYREGALVDEISTYFKHEIPEVQYDDEDMFIDVLKKAGLTDG
ncbi:hypothetical protein BSKO_12669 [Bryopsis sp. KO-2023]|nr:hypothetical protein BSKO_12669 [Bryopsis sp. KO-2023]